MNLNQITNETLTISQEELFELWSSISSVDLFNQFSFTDFETIFQLDIENEPNNLQFNPTGWEIKLKQGIVRASILAIIETMVLKAMNQSDIPLTILLLIVPLLFDVNEIKLDDNEKAIYLDLSKNPKIFTHTYTPIKLYENHLSKKIKKDLNKLDFLSFLEKLKKIGLLKKNFKEKVIIKQAGKFHCYISIS